MDETDKEKFAGWYINMDAVVFAFKILNHFDILIINHVLSLFACVLVSRSGGGVPVPWGKSSPQRLPGLQCLYFCLWTNWQVNMMPSLLSHESAC